MKANLKRRLLTAALGVPLLILLVGWGRPWHFTGVIILVTAVALYEYFLMVFPDNLKERFLGVGFGILASSWMIVHGFDRTGLGLSMLIVTVFSIYLFGQGELRLRFIRLSWTLLGVLYIGYLLPHWILLFEVPNGREWVFFVLLVIMSGDTTGYLVGSAAGKRKLAPEISPGKTVEGAMGFLVGSMLAGVLGVKVLLLELPLVEAVLLSGFLGLLGQLGDLFESWIKRVFDRKDSGALLPGHGGLLDRLDSLIFPVVFATHYVKLFHP